MNKKGEISNINSNMDIKRALGGRRIYNADLENLKKSKDVKIFKFGASTKGGQRANKTETGIRLYHIPSGIRVKVIEERFQARNLEIAYKRLQKKLEKLNQPRKKRRPTAVPRAVKERRLEQKRKQSQKKQMRKPISF